MLKGKVCSLARVFVLFMLFLNVSLYGARLLQVASLHTNDTLESFINASDYPHYFYSASRFLSGERVYCDPFKPEIGPRQDIRVATNPPGLVMVSAPFSLLTYGQSWAAWNLFCAMIMVLGFYALLTELYQHKGISVLIVSAIILGPSFASNFYFSQAQSLLAGLVAFYFVFLLRNRNGWAGLFLGAVVFIKLLLVPLLLFHFLRKDWKLVGVAMLVCFSGTAVLLLSSNLSGSDFYLCSLPMIANAAAISSFNVGLLGMLNNTLHYGVPDFIDKVLTHRIITVVGAAIILGAILRINRQAGLSERCWTCAGQSAVIVILSIMYMPLVWPHYFLLLFPAIFILVKKLKWPLWSPLVLIFLSPLFPNISSSQEPLEVSLTIATLALVLCFWLCMMRLCWLACSYGDERGGTPKAFLE